MKSLGVFKDFSDDSLKSVFDIGENKIIEMTLLANKPSMDVVCVPTHHFCNLGCKMCHLTNKGLNKKMIAIKVDDFLEALRKTVTKKNGERRTNKKKLLISFMGVGEPLLNLKLIEDVYCRENEIKSYLGYEQVSYALSTMMPNKNLTLLTQIVSELTIPLKVHFSLHSPINQERFLLIPSTQVTVEEAMNLLLEYRNNIQKNEIIMNKYKEFHRTNDPIEIHYTLIKETNDQQTELDTLLHLLKKYPIPIKFIRFNPNNHLERSEKEEYWIKFIHDNLPNLRIKTYTPPGREIGSSCGEFTKHYYHTEIETEEQLKEFEQWKKEHELLEDV